MNEFGKTLMRRNKEIANSFIIVNGKKKINNGIIENRNKTIKNIEHDKMAIPTGKDLEIG